MLSRHIIERALRHVLGPSGAWCDLESVVARVAHTGAGLTDVVRALQHPQSAFELSLSGTRVRSKPAGCGERRTPRVTFLDVDAPSHRVVNGVVSHDFCRAWVQRLGQAALEAAPINTAAGAVRRTDVRNNQRLIVDDAQLADAIWPMVRPWVPNVLFGGAWMARGLNTRFRAYRYGEGAYFKPHRDGAYHESSEARSWYTVLLYLDENMQGGGTRLIDAGVRVTPAVGRLLVFQHALLHEGETVHRGVKHVLRTDVMYTRMA